MLVYRVRFSLEGARIALVEAARFRGFWAFWWSVRGSCYKESAGCVVVGVGESVSNAA